MLPMRLTRLISSHSRLLCRSKASSAKPEHLSNNEEKIRIDPLKSRDYFQVHKLFTIEDLFRARVHLGHTATSTSAQMKPFIYGNRFNTAIIDLDETALLLRQALNFLAHIAYKEGVILFSVRQPQLVHLVERAAIECGEYAHCRKWRSTLFTASEQEFGFSVRKPDLMIFMHTKDGSEYNDHQAIVDAAKLNIPTMAIVDTDCDPNIITFPVPGNDDSLESQQLYLHLFKQAILLGKKKRKEDLVDQ